MFCPTPEYSVTLVADPEGMPDLLALTTALTEEFAALTTVSSGSVDRGHDPNDPAPID